MFPPFESDWPELFVGLTVALVVKFWFTDDVVSRLLVGPDALVVKFWFTDNVVSRLLVGPELFVGSRLLVGPELFVGSRLLVGPELFVGSRLLVGPELFVGSRLLVGPELFVGSRFLVGPELFVFSSLRRIIICPNRICVRRNPFFTLQLGVLISGVASVAFLFKFLFRLTEVEDRVSSSSACNV